VPLTPARAGRRPQMKRPCWVAGSQQPTLVICRIGRNVVQNPRQCPCLQARIVTRITALKSIALRRTAFNYRQPQAVNTPSLARISFMPYTIDTIVFCKNRNAKVIPLLAEPRAHAGGEVLAFNARRKPAANRLLVEQQAFHARDLLRLIPRAQDLIDVVCDGSDAIQCGGRLRNESHSGSCAARAGIAAPAQPTVILGITTGETLNRVQRCNATNTDF